MDEAHKNVWHFQVEDQMASYLTQA